MAKSRLNADRPFCSTRCGPSALTLKIRQALRCIGLRSRISGNRGVHDQPHRRRATLNFGQTKRIMDKQPTFTPNLRRVTCRDIKIPWEGLLDDLRERAIQVNVCSVGESHCLSLSDASFRRCRIFAVAALSPRCLAEYNFPVRTVAHPGNSDLQMRRAASNQGPCVPRQV